MPTPRSLIALTLLAAGTACGLLLWQRSRGRALPRELPPVGENLTVAPGEAALEDIDRVAVARVRVEPELRELCRDAGLQYPPADLFLRAFKHEAELEVWGAPRSQPFRKIQTFPITCSSGGPGPKRREGDRQVPEGFYAIDLFNPKSSFHLSMRVNYPNASDRILSDPETPGSDIYLHGKEASIGCLPLGDANIERLYILALDSREQSQRPIPIHIFPARMSGGEWSGFAGEHATAGLGEFWASLKRGYDVFERTRQLPRVEVDSAGRYLVFE